MAQIEYTCRQCRHRFTRVVFQGDEPEAVVCPVCRNKTAVAAKAGPRLFDGISPSSQLARDTN